MGCGKKEPKERLLRLARSPDGIVQLDVKEIVAGRGAWVHRRTPCLDQAEQPRALGRAFRGKARQPKKGALLEEAMAANVRLEDEQREGGGSG